MSWWLLLSIAPLFEELAFRGLIQTELMRFPLGRAQRAGISGANLTTSLLFGLAHLTSSVVNAFAVLPPSLVLGWLRERTGKVAPCIIVHAAYNGGLLLVLTCA